MTPQWVMTETTSKIPLKSRLVVVDALILVTHLHAVLVSAFALQLSVIIVYDPKTILLATLHRTSSRPPSSGFKSCPLKAIINIMLSLFSATNTPFILVA